MLHLKQVESALEIEYSLDVSPSFNGAKTSYSPTARSTSIYAVTSIKQGIDDIGEKVDRGFQVCVQQIYCLGSNH